MKDTKAQTIAYIHDLLVNEVLCREEIVSNIETELSTSGMSDAERKKYAAQLDADQDIVVTARKMLADFERHEWH